MSQSEKGWVNLKIGPRVDLGLFRLSIAIPIDSISTDPYRIEITQSRYTYVIILQRSTYKSFMYILRLMH